MHALVTGATGFVGGRLVRELVAQGVTVRALVRPSSDRRAIADLPVEYMLGDLCDPQSLAQAVKETDVLFHVAADYRFWVPNPATMHQANVEGTVALMRAALDAGVPRIVYTSSTVTVDCSTSRLGTEDDFVSPGECRSTYQLTKVLAEQAVWELIRQGAPITILNPSTPIGAGDHRPTPTGQLIVDYLNGRLPAYLNTVLNWIDVEDVAKGHWLAATKGRIGQRYILGHANWSLQHMLAMLSDASGQPAPRIKIPYALAYAAGIGGEVWGRLSGRRPQAALDGIRMAARPMQYDASKAVQELGMPQTPIRGAVAEAVHWYRAHGYVSKGGIG